MIMASFLKQVSRQGQTAINYQNYDGTGSEASESSVKGTGCDSMMSTQVRFRSGFSKPCQYFFWLRNAKPSTKPTLNPKALNPNL